MNLFRPLPSCGLVILLVVVVTSCGSSDQGDGDTHSTAGTAGAAGSESPTAGIAGEGQTTGGSSHAGESASDGGSSAAGETSSGGAPDGGDSSQGGSSAGASGVAGGSGVARPEGNTGIGFFTKDGKLYDANGVEFRIKGVNTCHYDENWASCSSNCGIPNSGANVNRIGTPLWSSISSTTLQGLMDRMISQKVVPMPGVWYVNSSYSDNDNVTCKDDAAAFETAVSQWVSRAALFKPYERYMLLNIANEWGPSNSTAWRDAYIDAVGQLRDAGYLCTLVIDAGGCGQDLDDIAKYAQAIYDSDPQHNIVFSEHVYGMWGSEATGLESWQIDLADGFDQMAATGLPILIGEFGPGRDIGPSPTMMTPGTIIQNADDHGFGWLAWAWDDDYAAGDDGFALSNQGGFSLSNGEPDHGEYPDNTDLTAFGNEVVLNPSFGTFGNAQPATIF